MRYHIIRIGLALLWINLAMIDANPPIKHSAEIDLLNFMSRSSHLLQRDLPRTMSCFDYYIPLLTEIAQQYEEQNKLCTTRADDERTRVEADVADDIADLAKRSDEACCALKLCKNSEPAKFIFECYAEEGSVSSKSLHAISNEANVKSANLNELLRRIDADEYVCYTNNKVQYEDDSAAAYEEFSKCIDGEIEVPTETTEGPTESTTPGTTEVTEGPTDSTTPGSTEATEGPTDSTTPGSTEATEGVTDSTTPGTTQVTEDPTDSTTPGTTQATTGPTDSTTPDTTEATEGPTDSTTPGSTEATEGTTDSTTPGSTEATDGITDSTTPGTTEATEGTTDSTTPGTTEVTEGPSDSTTPRSTEATEGPTDSTTPGTTQATAGPADSTTPDTTEATEGPADSTTPGTTENPTESTETTENPIEETTEVPAKSNAASLRSFKKKLVAFQSLLPFGSTSTEVPFGPSSVIPFGSSSAVPFGPFSANSSRISSASSSSSFISSSNASDDIKMKDDLYERLRRVHKLNFKK
uniref:Protein TsetseEP domain-containing protein n=1 Tax=Stomoxys calcitrans TaxID=35570 RepID=A0A1I8PSR8_STOCA